MPRRTFYNASQVRLDLELRSAMETVALEFPLYGCRRMTVALRCRGWLVNNNCVINLSPDKPSVFADMFRALKPGGRVSSPISSRPGRCCP